MKTSMPEPCAEWAEQLAAVSFADLAPADQVALRAHLATCAACAAVKAEYRRMDAQIRALPSARPLDGLPPALLQLWAEEDQRQHAASRMIPLWSSEDGMRTREENNVAKLAPNPQPQHRHVRRLVSGISAIAAVVVIAIVVTALVFSRGARPANTGNAPGNTPGGQGWQALPHLTNLPGLPVIAPSNPQVVYAPQLTDTNEPLLQRSDDGGASWHDLPIPAGITRANAISVFVSPLDAKRVFVELQTACQTAQANTIAPAIAQSGSGGICAVDYFSTDGGSHWSQVQWPIHQTGPFSPRLGDGAAAPLQAQGDRLYALLTVASHDSNNGWGDIGHSLLTSADGGATWQFADQDLITQGYNVYAYAPTPTGNTVFAVADIAYPVVPGALNSLVSPQSGGSKLKIWRSDDAGAHWTAVAPYNGGLFNLRVSLNDAGQPVLYQDDFIPQYNPPFPTTLKVSVDGGKTWQSAPSVAGQFSTSGILGMLSDGSVIEARHQSQLFSWKAGDAAWHPLAGAFQGEVQYVLVTPSGDGQETLWLVTKAKDRYSVQRLTL